MKWWWNIWRQFKQEFNEQLEKRQMTNLMNNWCTQKCVHESRHTTSMFWEQANAIKLSNGHHKACHASRNSKHGYQKFISV